MKKLVSLDTIYILYGNFLLNRKNNLIYKGRITKNLCDSIFDFGQKYELCKA